MLVNAWRLKYKKRRKPKKKKEVPEAMAPYQRRNGRLKELGYRTYAEYLESDDWRRIRDGVLSRFPVCCACDNPSSQVHHLNYSYPVLLGYKPDYLFAICRGCHEAIEFDGKEKRSIADANLALQKLVSAKGRHRLASRMTILRETEHTLFATPKKKPGYDLAKQRYFRGKMERTRKNIFGGWDHQTTHHSPQMTFTEEHFKAGRSADGRFNHWQMACLRLEHYGDKVERIRGQIGKEFTALEITRFIECKQKAK